MRGRNCSSSRWKASHHRASTPTHPTSIGENREIGDHRLLGRVNVPRSVPPSMAKTWARAAATALERNDLLGALRSYRSAVECDDDSGDTWIGLAEVFSRLDDATRAGECLRLARRLQGRAGA